MKTLKIVLFVICLVPLVLLGWDGYAGNLGANPIETITRSTGSWTLIFLLVTLGVTPLRRLSGWNDVIKFRRMLGLFAFFYACLHFTTYFWIDQFFDLLATVKDVVKRPSLTVGFRIVLFLLVFAVS